MSQDKPERVRPPSLTDVARLGGVSVSTAARVLRDDETHVSAELAERVRLAAVQIGYVPNIVAQGLRRGRLGSVGLIVGDILDPYFGEIAESVTIEANAYSMLAMVSNMQRDRRLEIRHAQSLWQYQVSGLILAAGASIEAEERDELTVLLNRIRHSGTVVVALAPQSAAIPTFSVDNRAVGDMIASRLLALGHRRIGVVGDQHNLTYRERLTGIEAALARAGVVPAIAHGEYTLQAASSGTDQLLSAMPDVTAIVGASDRVAQGVARRLEELGRRIPDDVAIVGIGNTEYAHMRMPSLATVDVKLAESGRAAVAYIASQTGKPVDPGPMTLKAEFVEGGTLGPAKS
jgi:LacI family transcriptional regulator